MGEQSLAGKLSTYVIWGYAVLIADEWRCLIG